MEFNIKEEDYSRLFPLKDRKLRFETLQVCSIAFAFCA
jgi:hypothetical protein